MTSLLTALAFVAITALLVGMHMRKTGGARGASGSDTCPRCRAPHVPGALRCSACGVPFQTYEILNAPLAKAEEAPSGAETGAKLHAVVRADICVGCATCVAACPEPGAIGLQGKLAVVNDALCVAHGRCAEACPVGAIVLTTGAAVHRVEVPLLDAHFQSNLPGLYIAGELGGRGLIKNAINEGKIAIEHIAGEVGRGGPSERDESVFEVAIVGSGPAGLSAGLEALRRGLRYVVLEQGSFADSIRKYPRHKVLLAEPVIMPLYGSLWIGDSSKESLLEVWESILAGTGLDVRTGVRVTGVTREGAAFRLETDSGEIRARRVVLALGRRGTPRKLGVPGEGLAKVLYDIIEMEAFQGRRVLVVGGGDSAIESALGLANQQGAQVVLSYRGADFKRVKERNLAKLHAALAAGKLAVELRSEVREIRPDAVVIEVGGGPKILPNDDVIVRIGGDPSYAFLQRTGVRIVRKDIPIPGAGVGAAGAF